jgi:hypothetical protein
VTEPDLRELAATMAALTPWQLQEIRALADMEPRPLIEMDLDKFVAALTVEQRQALRAKLDEIAG